MVWIYIFEVENKDHFGVRNGIICSFKKKNSHKYPVGTKISHTLHNFSFHLSNGIVHDALNQMCKHPCKYSTPPYNRPLSTKTTPLPLYKEHPLYKDHSSTLPCNIYFKNKLIIKLANLGYLKMVSVTVS